MLRTIKQTLYSLFNVQASSDMSVLIDMAILLTETNKYKRSEEKQ